MAYILRFVQRYNPSDTAAFMALEAKFAALERTSAGLPHGRRSQPFAGKEPNNTLIWECQFPSLQEAQQAVAALSASKEHQGLLRQQARYMTDAWTEIYQVLEL
jgi:hypothetical protein